MNEEVSKNRALHIAPHGARVIAVWGIVLTILGVLAYADQTFNGLGTSNMNNMFNWGLAIAVFAFLVGFGAGGQLMASLMVLKHHGAPSRLAAVSSIIGTVCAIGAGIAIMIDLGNPSNIFAMLSAPNTWSPLTWDMGALTLFIICSIVMSYLIVAPWAYENGHTGLYKWIRKCEDHEAANKRVANKLKVVAIIGIVLAVVLQLVEGWIFAEPRAHIWWHSILVPIDFVAVALACGSSLITGIGAMTVGRNGIDSGWDEVGKLASFAAKCIIIHLVLAIGELVIVATTEGEMGQMVVQQLMAYWPLYFAELLLPLIAAILFWQPCKTWSLSTYAFAAVLVVIGIFCHRLMLLYPSFNVIPLTDGLASGSSTLWEYPISSGLTGGASGFITNSAYLPSLGEWGIAALAIGLVLLVGSFVCGHYRLLGADKCKR